MGLGGIALYGIMLAFFGTLAGMIIDCTINISQEILAQGWLSKFNFLTPGGMVSHAKVLEEVFFAGGDKNLNVLGLIFSLAWVIYAIALITQLFKLFGDPGSGAKTPAVGSTLIKFGVYAFLLASCYPLLEMILGWYSQLISGIATIGEEMVAQGEWQTLGSSLFSQALDPQWYIFFCILAFGVGTAMIGCMLTYIERYVAMAIYVYLAPLCVAMGVNDETSDVFKKWVMGLIGQMFALALSIILMGAAYRALVSGIENGQSGMPSVNGVGTADTLDAGVRSIRIIMCIVLLGASKNSEKFFNMLGFSTMNFGDAGRTFAAGLATAAMAARALAAPAKAGGKKIDKKIDGAMEKMAKRPPKVVENGKVEAGFGAKPDTKSAAKSMNNLSKEVGSKISSANTGKSGAKTQAKELNDAVAKAGKEKTDTAKELEKAKEAEAAAKQTRNEAAARVSGNDYKDENGNVKGTALDLATDRKVAADAAVKGAKEDLTAAKKRQSEAQANAANAAARVEAAQQTYEDRNTAESSKALNDAMEGKKAADEKLSDANREVAEKQAALNSALDSQAAATKDYRSLGDYKKADEAYSETQKAAEKAQTNYKNASEAYDSAVKDAHDFSVKQGEALVKDLPKFENSAQIAALVGDMDNRYSYEQTGWAVADNGALSMVVAIKDPNHMNRTVDTIAMQIPGSESLKSVTPGSAMVDLSSGKVVGYTGSSGGTETAATGMNYVSLNDSAPRDYVLQPGESFSDAQTRFEQTKQNNNMTIETGGISGISALLNNKVFGAGVPDGNGGHDPNDPLGPVPDIKD